MDLGTGTVDSLHGTVDIFHVICNRKIIHLILELAGAENYAKRRLNFSEITF
jgi:hypothetical protein